MSRSDTQRDNHIKTRIGHSGRGGPCTALHCTALTAARLLVGVHDGGDALAVHGLAPGLPRAAGVHAGQAPLAEGQRGAPGHLGEDRLLVARVVHVDLPRRLRLRARGRRVTPPQALPGRKSSPIIGTRPVCDCDFECECQPLFVMKTGRRVAPPQALPGSKSSPIIIINRPVCD